jgi:hypothetical protein
MKIAAQFSFKDGFREITSRHPELFAEVKKAIHSIAPELSECKSRHGRSRVEQKLYDPVMLSKAFKGELYPKGWKRVLVDCEFPTPDYIDGSIRSGLKGAFRDLDFVKDRLGVELHLCHLPVCSVCAKMTIFRNLGFIDCGIEIVPVKALALEMSSGVSYFEQFVWDLESRGVADIDIPVLILGVDA